MRDRDSQLLWEAYDFENELKELRASLHDGAKGTILTDYFRDNPDEASDESSPVKVTFANIQKPVVKELKSGKRVTNWVGHWSLEPGEPMTRTAVGKSVQDAMLNDSPVSFAAEKIGKETNVPGTMQTVIINVVKDESFSQDIEHKQNMNQSAERDAARWKHD